MTPITVGEMQKKLAQYSPGLEVWFADDEFGGRGRPVTDSSLCHEDGVLMLSGHMKNMEEDEFLEPLEITK